MNGYNTNHVDRIEHLKEARKMATQAINELQELKNGELAKIQQESTNHTELEQSIKEDTDKKLAAIKEQFEKNKQEAIDKLVSSIKQRVVVNISMQAPNHLQQHSPVPAHMRQPMQSMSAGMPPPGMHVSSAMGPPPPGSVAQPNGSMHPPPRPMASTQGHVLRQSRQPMSVQAPPHSAPHPSAAQQPPPPQQSAHMPPPGAPQPQQQQQQPPMALQQVQQSVTPTQRLSAMTEEVWLQIGSLSETMNEPERALAAYDNALRHNPYSQTALTQIANIYRSREEFDKAVEYFQRIINIDNTNGEIWGAVGNCYLMLDDLPKAYQAYQNALNSLEEAKEPKLWYGIGIMYDRYCSYDHAEEAFVGVLNMDPNFDKANEIYFRLGIIHKCQGKYSQSLECFNRILKDPPKPLTEADIWFQIGNVHELSSEFGLAKEAYERVLRENPQHVKVLQQLAMLYFRPNTSLTNIDAAVQLLTSAIEMDSDKADAQMWYLLGRCCMVQRQFNKAYEAYQQAVYRDGNNANYWCSIGVLYYQINQYRDALDAYSRAIRIDPYLSEVWFDLGALYEACNNQVNDAIDAYTRAAELDRSNPVIEQRLELLRRMQSSGQTSINGANPPPTPIDPVASTGTTGRLNARGGPANDSVAPGALPDSLGAPPVSGPMPSAPDNAHRPSDAATAASQQPNVPRSTAPTTPAMSRPGPNAGPQYGQHPKAPPHVSAPPGSRPGYPYDNADGRFNSTAGRSDGTAPMASSGPYPQTLTAQQPPVSRPYSATGHPQTLAGYTPHGQMVIAGGPRPEGSRQDSPATFQQNQPQQQSMAHGQYTSSTPVVSEPHAGTFLQGPSNGYSQYGPQNPEAGNGNSPSTLGKGPGFRRPQSTQQSVPAEAMHMDRRAETMSDTRGESQAPPPYGRQGSTASAGAAILTAHSNDRDGDVVMEDRVNSLREESMAGTRTSGMDLSPIRAPQGSGAAADVSMASSTSALAGPTAAPIRLPPVQHGGSTGLTSPGSRASPRAAPTYASEDQRKSSLGGPANASGEAPISLASAISAAEEDKEGSAINSLMSLSSVATTLTSRPQASTPSTSSPQLPALKTSTEPGPSAGHEASLDASVRRGESVTNGVREMDISSAKSSAPASEIAAPKSPTSVVAMDRSDGQQRSRGSSPLAGSEGGSAAVVPSKRSLSTAAAGEMVGTPQPMAAEENTAAAEAGDSSRSKGSSDSSNGVGPRKRGRQGSPSPGPGKRLSGGKGDDDMHVDEEPEDGEVIEDDEGNNKSRSSEDVVVESGNV
ncbi:glucose repression mediator protein [Coemansia sp. RSA 1821]|nr:glucose repression mediator protein [Coemansia sp. RSA 1821]